jgi:stalled ribosome rescue protein Dom34
MQHTHACVWIDHREAKIFAMNRDETSEVILHDHDAPKHIHRKADNVRLGKAEPNRRFLDDVTAALAPFKAILIAGPGDARTQLAGYLSDAHPLTAKNIWGIEPMDHPTEPELIAAARKYFRAADRMHT